jgi:DNA modification methylase
MLQIQVGMKERYGLNNYINLVFRKNFSAQVLKANMKVVGNCEYGLLFYREKLPKFNNKGKMIMNCIDWERDTTTPKIHPTQKPVKLLEKLIEIFTDENDVVIDPCCGSGSTLLASVNKGRKAYGFEIKKNFYNDAKNLLENHKTTKQEIEEYGFAKTELEKINPTLF